MALLRGPACIGIPMPPPGGVPVPSPGGIPVPSPVKYTRLVQVEHPRLLQINHHSVLEDHLRHLNVGLNAILLHYCIALSMCSLVLAAQAPKFGGGRLH